LNLSGQVEQSGSLRRLVCDRLAGYLAALWRRPLTFWVGLAFPAVFGPTHGQTSFLTRGLLQLPRCPVLAGILFRVVTLKPHLGLLLLVAVVASRH